MNDRTAPLLPAYTNKTVAFATVATAPPAEANMVSLDKFPGGGPVYVRVLLRGSTSTERVLTGATYWGRRGTVTYELGPVNNGVDTVVSTTRGVSDELVLVGGAFEFLGVSGTLAGDSLVIEVLPMGIATE